MRGIVVTGLLLTLVCTAAMGQAALEGLEDLDQEFEPLDSAGPLISEPKTTVVEEEAPKTFPRVRLMPVDEAQRDKAFEDFRTRLLAALKTKDLAFLLAHVDQNIKNSFGGQNGIAEFRRKWKLDTKPAKSELWAELQRVVELGGTFKREVFTAPYVFAKFPEEFDAYSYGAITGRNVNIRTQPRSNAPGLGKESLTIVRMLGQGEKEVVELIGNDAWPWRKIGLPDGTEGYVYGKFVRSPLDYRAFFKPVGDTWKLFGFMAGD
jgi:hypothetical protein